MKSIGALVRFELNKKGLNIAEQHLLIGGVLRFAERQIWSKTLFQIKNFVIENTDHEISIQLEIFIEHFTAEGDYVSFFDKSLVEYRDREFSPGYCPTSTDFTWKWDHVTRLGEVGDGGMQILMFRKGDDL